MKALVTGATGCVGANVVAALLERGYDVRAMRRASSRLDALAGLEVEMVIGDLFDQASLAQVMAGCDIVFHIAAVSGYWRTSVEMIYHVNVDGTRNVVEAALAAGIKRLVYTSSISALGVSHHDELLDEETIFGVPPHRFPYGHSKHLAEGVAQEAVEQGLDAVIVNPATVIGPRDVNWIAGTLLKEVRRGTAWFAPPGGVCWAAATDVGVGHALAAEQGQTGQRYILGGENLTHREAIEITAGLMDARRPLFTLPRPLMGPLAAVTRVAGPALRLPLSTDQVWLSGEKLYCDSSKAVRELGYPQTPFRIAVEQAYAWYRRRGLLE